MRVVLLGQNACTADAIGRQVAAKVRFFRDRGEEVRVFLSSGERLHPDVRCHAVCAAASKLWRDPAHRRDLLDADLVLADYAGHYDLIDLLPALARGKPSILFNYHGVTPSRLATGGLSQRLRRDEEKRNLVWCADLAWVHSRFMAQELHQATGFPQERILVAPCLVEPPVSMGKPAAHERRARLGLQNATVLLFVGRVAVNKRLPLLIEAVQQLRGREPPVHLVVVGDDTDSYATEARHCLRTARERGVSDRVHFLGRASDEELAAWYHAADLLVLPSVHEGFGLPAIEAMGSDLPVLVARAGALPDTAGVGGLSFASDDLHDLVRQIERISAGRMHDGVASGRIAIVVPRFGADFVGGAERSLGLMASALRESGQTVEVFTTCNGDDAAWNNRHREGTSNLDGFAVHRFAIDAFDRAAFEKSLIAIRSGPRAVARLIEEDYWNNSLRSSRLLDALASRFDEFQAVIVGPYLFGLALETIRRFKDRVLLAPCFHDEPMARLSQVERVYSQAGGMLFHSRAEQEFAAAELGMHHPNSHVVGTWLNDALPPGNAARGRELCGDKYVVYCGRYSTEKGVDRLLAWFARFQEQRPGRLRLVLIGQGRLSLPRAAWLVNVGFVDEETKRDVLAGALALVQLSTNESLSLVTLEAWREGTPVLGHSDAAVVRTLINQADGGRHVRDAGEFLAALDDLADRPEAWRAAGARGRAFVREHYCSKDGYVARLLAAVRQLREPLAEQMRRRGRERAGDFGPSAWQARLEHLVAATLEARRRGNEVRLKVELVGERHRRLPLGEQTVVAVRVTNRGNAPAVDEGPARVVLQLRTRPGTATSARVTIPRVLAPGQTDVVLLPVVAPTSPGPLDAIIEPVLAEPEPERQSMEDCRLPNVAVESDCRHVLEVDDATVREPRQVAGPLLDGVQSSAARAVANQALPTDYEDVSLGALAAVKRRIKQKLLHNFRTAYVDVLARQQSAFNAEAMLAVTQLAEAVTVLDRQGRADFSSVTELLHKVGRRQGKLLRRLRALDRRLRRIEAALPSGAGCESARAE